MLLEPMFRRYADCTYLYCQGCLSRSKCLNTQFIRKALAAWFVWALSINDGVGGLLPAGSISLSLLPFGGRKQSKLQVILLGLVPCKLQLSTAFCLEAVQTLLPLARQKASASDGPSTTVWDLLLQATTYSGDEVQPCAHVFHLLPRALAVGTAGTFWLGMLSFIPLPHLFSVRAQAVTFGAVTDHVNAASCTAILWCWAEAVGICLLLKLHVELKAVM